MGHNYKKKGKGQVSLLIALLLTTSAAVTAFAISEFNATNYSEVPETPSLELTITPELSAVLKLPHNLTRGQMAEFEVFVTNNRNSSVETIELLWYLSPGIETVQDVDNCTGLASGDSCVFSLIVNGTMSTILGPNEVRGEVRYG